MVRNLFQKLFLFSVLISLPLLGQESPTHATQQSTCPSGQPSVYAQDVSNWHLLSPATPSKVKAKHAFLSSLSYGAVAAPMVVEYSGIHAQVQVHATRPHICVSHLITSNAPMLVRLNEKKQTRELDSGSIRAIPLVGSARQAQAVASSIVPTTTLHTENGMILIQPQTDLVLGEYAVMFGAQNLAIFDFGVTTP